MRSGNVRRLVVGILLFVAYHTAGAADEAESRLRSLAASLGQRQPLVRIGLDAAHRVAIRGTGPFRILDLATGEPVWKPRFEEELQVVAEGGPKEGVPSIYRIQVGAFNRRETAEEEKRRLERLVGAPGVVHHDPDRGTWRVRLGAAEDRLALGPLMEKLRATGAEGPWIAEEPAESVGGVRLRLVDASYDSHPAKQERLAVVPARGERILVDDKPYRGLIELRISPFGTVRPVNWIEIEKYLLGVVPAELGPEVWPELQALQAQAVAARTYVQRNIGQFGDEGFDLCATPRCQVYEGASAEHPLSDRAVWATRGEVLVWQGRPIAALYTATCGGHTEQGGSIFPEHGVPYLDGVPCRAEGDALAALRGSLRGRKIEPLADETAADVTRDWALLEAAGVIDASSGRGEAANRTVDAARLRGWTTALSRMAGLPVPQGEPREVADLGRAAVLLLDDLGWTERADVLLSTEDLPALLRDPSSTGLDGETRRALGYLAWVEGLRPFADGRFHPERPATAARLAPALVRIGESYRAFGLESATVAGVSDASLRLIQGKGKIRRPVAKDAALFGLAGGRPVPAERLEIWPGDRVRFRSGPAGAIDFLELQPPVKGTSDDRSARVYSWEVRRTRRELEAAINRRVSVGRLKELEILRRGVSGRVVELEVVGERGSTVVRGFDVRRLLDLRESLLVIEPQRDEQGRIEAVVFAGKGWGHGVGLCQVGAYGMALRGASYREILDHYYSGATLERPESADR